MNKKLTITIGIPAYNEGANIRFLLKSLVDQKEDRFKLIEIIVISDCSTDNTESEVKKIKDKRINLIINKKRSGQVLVQNTIVNIFKGGLLVLLNGDILIKNKDFISRFIAPVLDYKKVGLVSIRPVPLPATTFFEKIINFSVAYKYSFFERWKNGRNLFTCRGSARVFSRKFAKICIWPKVRGEDAFSYLNAIVNGFDYRYVSHEQVFIKSPEHLGDHLNQSKRFFSNSGELYTYFSKDFVKKECTIPASIILSQSIIYFCKNPVYFLAYLAISVYSKLTPPLQAGHIWESPATTKKLIS